MSRGLRNIGVIGFNGVNAVDIVGPLEAFASAGREDYTRKESRGCYALHVLGLSEAPFRTESGVRMLPEHSLHDAPSLDTIIVPGGWGLREPATNTAVSAWLRARAPRTRRVACVCTGIYGLAPTGLLDGRRVTTHWRFTSDVAQRFPRLRVEGDALYLKDDRYYTSGGVTAGIDLALALIEEDFGSRAALTVAREMVVYVKRPGGQEQYSEPLRDQVRAAEGFSDLVAWMLGHLGSDLSGTALAAQVGLSPRHFSRRFAATFACTPAEYVERLRLNAARERLSASRRTVEAIAASVGFGSADVLTRRFRRRFGITPRQYRERFLYVPDSNKTRRTLELTA
jgi:transcriptional regulator GlxA family with amidase domain